MESQSDSKFTPPCPFCGHGRGRAREVAMQHHERTVTYSCSACDQSWTETDHVQSSGVWEEPPELKPI